MPKAHYSKAKGHIMATLMSEGYSESDASTTIDDFIDSITESPSNAEERFIDTFGLEPDYLLDLLF